MLTFPSTHPYVTTPTKGRGLQQLAVSLFFCVCIYVLLEVCAALGSAWWWSLYHSPSEYLQLHRCQSDGEGDWSIGLFKGTSPFHLLPLEHVAQNLNTNRSWPISNPVLTCSHIYDEPSSFVADPFLWPMNDGKTMYMLYESKSVRTGQGDIGAAVSHDGGLTFHHLAVVLDEPWHLSYPFLVKDKDQIYMIPEGSQGGTLRLYRAESFPTRWVLDSVLIEEPLIDASPFMHDGLWWMFASNRNEKSSKNCREMEIWFSANLKGPWQRHAQSPIRQWQQGSRSAGRPIMYKDDLYRFGQDCTRTYGHRVRAFKVKTLDAERYEEEEVPFEVMGTLREGVDWNGLRQHHFDAHEISDGQWIAAMDGDKYVSDYLLWGRLRRTGTLLLISLVCSAAAAGILWLYSNGYWSSSLKASTTGTQDVTCSPPHLKSLIQRCKQYVKCWVACFSSTLPAGSFLEQAGVSRGASSFCAAGIFSAHPSFIKGWSFSVALVVTAAGLAGLYLLASLVFRLCRMEILSLILWYVRTWSGNPAAIPLDNQYSKFSIVVMSYDARILTLQAFVQHYQHCASVGEIVVVWNKGHPPDPQKDLKSAGFVPVRIRVEDLNSMNNRFKPDPDIRNRGVLMLDDDIILPCADLERGFAAWREHPERITGYFPRLLEGDPPQYQCIWSCEKYTYDKGQYNVVLAGAAFMDKDYVFGLYSSHINHQGREYVDRVFNCDDLLLNYLLASQLPGNAVQHVQYVRPTKRLDVGKLTSIRLSGGGSFGSVRHNCTRDFASLFGNPLLGRVYPFDWGGLGKPTCGPSWLGCVFI